MNRILAMALLLAAGAPALADEVQLSTGKVLAVASVRPQGDEVWLELAGGGTLAVPAERVVAVREVALPDAGRTGERDAAAEVPGGPPPRRVETTGSGVEALIRQAAARHGVDPGLVRAVIQAESAGDATAVSSRGAMGLMQLMPATARARGVTDPFDPAQNIDAGTAELAAWIDGYAGEIALGLAAYNAGGRAVDRYDGIPPYRETLDYVRRVLDLYLDDPASP
ncbi:MAG: lytic transglycosylase domain-containing protein [Acidobacteriota bacterium]